ncbi:MULTISPECIES: Abi family protein [Acinetobacter]|jgi:hypothetical protein|uniref:Abi family protein n=4 Tax=Acinetobacter baumannii TaxID=470 RepID=A0AA90HX60_ACIBA|nr:MULTISPECIES: Abi family protein [Acinetobacter]ELO6155945.1 Abi family protein [Escherichia coli]MBC6802409.1 hypothetical protein [Acinetobacter baumannii]MBC6815960.1 hypothetical protein [Acinetobacter baumannii]MCR4532744.1 Abi family protein [Acinetobacter venetianus]MDC5051320.1 Abi family protein [Acinetobacter baumannii]
MNSSTTTINYAEVLQGISKKRLLPYNSTFAISPKKPELTMFSYTAHQDIATNLCYVLHLVEINLRNNLNDNFKAFVQKDDWMKSIELSSISLGQLKAAQQKVSGEFREKGKRKSPTYDDYLSQLMFGFWVHLLKFQFNSASGLDMNNFWTIHIDKVFPGRNGKDLNQIFNLLLQVKKTRDRFSHHEPLWKPSTSRYVKPNATDNFIHSVDYMSTLYDRELECLKICQPEAFNYIHHIDHRAKFIQCCNEHKQQWIHLTTKV